MKKFTGLCGLILAIAMTNGCAVKIQPFNPAIHSGSNIPQKATACIKLDVTSVPDLEDDFFYSHGLKTVKVPLSRSKTYYLRQSLQKALNKQFFSVDNDILCDKGEYILYISIQRLDFEKTSNSWLNGEEKMNAALAVYMIEAGDGRVIFERPFTRSMTHKPTSKANQNWFHKKVYVFYNELVSALTDDIALRVRSELEHITASKKPAKPVVAKGVADSRELDNSASSAVVKPAPSHFMGQKWALIVGISQYRDSRIPGLRYADEDARSFYEWIVSPEGGRYAPSRVKLLLNENATLAGIKEALFFWMREALAEDVVTLYFACHGSPDSPDASENLFLLPFDAMYDKIATTGFPMWDIETAINRYIKAKKIIVIADACHSGGIGHEFDISRRDSRSLEINPISSGLQYLSTVGEGICVISASDSRQYSQESEKWGGGHGVFTYFLLSALKGAADYNKDNVVSLGELIPYLSEHVRRETRNAQSPIVTGKFDPALFISR